MVGSITCGAPAEKKVILWSSLKRIPITRAQMASENYESKLSGMAKQALVIAAGKPVLLMFEYNAAGVLKKIHTEFEHRSLPDAVKIHCRKAEAVREGKKLKVTFV